MARNVLKCSCSSELAPVISPWHCTTATRMLRLSFLGESDHLDVAAEATGHISAAVDIFGSGWVHTVCIHAWLLLLIIHAKERVRTNNNNQELTTLGLSLSELRVQKINRRRVLKVEHNTCLGRNQLP